MLDASFVYVAVGYRCQTWQHRPSLDGGVWRIDRATGRAEQVSRTGHSVHEMLVLGRVLWLSEFRDFCRGIAVNEPNFWLVRHPMDGAAEQSISLGSSAEAGNTRPGDLLPGSGCIYYTNHATEDSYTTIERLDESTMKSTVMAAGKPFVSTRVGDFFYFLDWHEADQPRNELDLSRVSRFGGEAELLADDLAEWTTRGDYRAILHQGDDFVFQTKQGGIRALSMSGKSPRARDLVASADPERGHVEEAAIGRGAVIYVFGLERNRGMRAVSLGGGPSWQVVPPYRDPRQLVADDAGFYWINLADAEEDPQADAVFACDFRDADASPVAPAKPSLPGPP